MATFFENVGIYFTAQDLAVACMTTAVIYSTFKYLQIDMLTTVTTIVVLYVLYHWHIHTRKKEFEEYERDVQILIDSNLSLKSILEVNDPRIINSLHNLIPFQHLNSYSFENGVKHLDNFLRLYLDIVKRRVTYKSSHVSTARGEKTKALNAFMSILISVPYAPSIEHNASMLNSTEDKQLYRVVHELDHSLKRYLNEMIDETNREHAEEPSTSTGPQYLNHPTGYSIGDDMRTTVYL